MGSKLILNNLSRDFHKSALRFPNRGALEVGNGIFTYEQLSKMSGLLRSKILGFTEKSNKFISLLAYRSSTAYSGILGILGSGKGYVPLHPEFPAARNCKMLAFSNVDLMIVGNECRSTFDELLKYITKKMTFILVGFYEIDSYVKNNQGHSFILVENLSENGIPFEVESVENNDIAYLLFTSGSTGNPKGVPVSHGNVRSYVAYVSKKYQLTADDRCSQTFDLTFDPSVHDMFVTWQNGACLCVPSKDELFMATSFINNKQLSVWYSVPSVATIIDSYGRLGKGKLPNLRYSFFSGEALPISIAKKWKLSAPNSEIINYYGPTEATINITEFSFKNEFEITKSNNGISPIGWTFETQQFRLINENGEPCKIGEEGELCFSGSQVTKGYLNNDEKTKLQYVVFSDTGNTLWYKTGDLVRMDNNGCIYYLGRIDDQVKILGHRVELGEIDAAIRESSGSELAFSIPWPIKDGNAKGIVAFISRHKEPNKNNILEYCRNLLPKYMIPTKIHFIKTMPLTSNGKIDRAKLHDLANQLK